MKDSCKIIDNKPHCPKCNVLLSGGNRDYKLVEDDLGERYVEFTRECLKCFGKFKYILRLSMEAHERFETDSRELKEYKEYKEN